MAIEQGDGVRVRQHLCGGPNPYPQHSGRHGGGGRGQHGDRRGSAQHGRGQPLRGVHEQCGRHEHIKETFWFNLILTVQFLVKPFIVKALNMISTKCKIDMIFFFKMFTI